MKWQRFKQLEAEIERQRVEEELRSLGALQFGVEMPVEELLGRFLEEESQLPLN